LDASEGVAEGTMVVDDDVDVADASKPDDAATGISVEGEGGR